MYTAAMFLIVLVFLIVFWSAIDDTPGPYRHRHWMRGYNYPVPSNNPWYHHPHHNAYDDYYYRNRRYDDPDPGGGFWAGFAMALALIVIILGFVLYHHLAK